MSKKTKETDKTLAGFATRAVRDGQIRTHESEHSEAIFPTSSYVFSSAAEAAARFSGEEPGNIYSRFTNPTVRTFEQRLASLEGSRMLRRNSIRDGGNHSNVSWFVTDG